MKPLSFKTLLASLRRMLGWAPDVAAPGLAYSHRQLLDSILDNVVDGMITIDDKGLVLSYNRACRRIFGYAPEDVLGRNVSMLMPSPYTERHDGYLRQYLSTGQAKIIGIGREVEGRRKDGSVFPMDLSVAEVETSGGYRVFSGIVRDITARKDAENEMKRSNEELEKFAYVASHDLKAPLRNIEDLARWTIEDSQGLLPPEALRNLEMLCARVRSMEALLEGILAYSRAGRIADTPTEADTHALARRVAATHLPAGFQMEIRGRLPVLISPLVPLEQVFGNLFANAVKHHHRSDGRIAVEARAVPGGAEFIVRDDGPGIPAEFRHRVFEMFQTLKPADNGGGSGLGLAIVKKLVEWRGGKVWAADPPEGVGAEIHFTWPSGPGARQ